MNHFELLSNLLGAHSITFDSQPPSGVGSVIEDYTVSSQEKSNWCWAAVGKSVRLLYEKLVVPQCEIANEVLGASNCCSVVNDCNKTALLSAAIGKNYEDYESYMLSLDVLKTEITQGHPVGAAIHLSDTNKHHFVVVYGFMEESGETELLFGCPKNESFTAKAQPDSTSEEYGQVATWEFSYFTQKAAE